MMPFVTKADDGNTLYCYSKSTTVPVRISLDELDKMTFYNDGIQMWNQNGNMNNILFDDLLLFTFVEIEHPYVTTVKSSCMPTDLSIQYSVNQGTLIVESGQQLNSVIVYDLQGRIVAKDVSNGSNYSIVLPKSRIGIYLVKVMYDNKVFIEKVVL